MVRTYLFQPIWRAHEATIVNGEPVPFSLVTEEHQDAMTPEEYTAYYELLSAQS